MMGWGVRIGGKRLKILGYADNLMILAEDEEGIRWLITRLEKYIDGKELRLNAENTKKNKVWEQRKGKKRKGVVVVEGRRDRRDKGCDIFGVQI